MSISRGRDGTPVAFHDLPADHFPLTITALLDRREQLWERRVEPYVVIDVPGASREQQGRIWLRVRCANGLELWQPPMTPEAARSHIEAEIAGNGGETG